MSLFITKVGINIRIELLNVGDSCTNTTSSTTHYRLHPRLKLTMDMQRIQWY